MYLLSKINSDIKYIVRCFRERREVIKEISELKRARDNLIADVECLKYFRSILMNEAKNCCDIIDHNVKKKMI